MMHKFVVDVVYSKTKGYRSTFYMDLPKSLDIVLNLMKSSDASLEDFDDFIDILKSSKSLEELNESGIFINNNIYSFDIIKEINYNEIEEFSLYDIFDRALDDSNMEELDYYSTSFNAAPLIEEEGVASLTLIEW